jgi:hypothetical protein
MEKIFREMTELYKGHFALKSKLDKEYSEAQASGDHSNKYLKNLSKTHGERMEKERKAINLRLMTLRQEFIEDLNARYSLETKYISDTLIKLLNCGIRLNEREFEQLAIRHKDNLAESRLLHDKAEDCGYILDNYNDYDTVLLKFDNFKMHISNDLLQSDALLRFFPTTESCEFYAGQILAESSNSSYECHKIPQSIEESILYDLSKENKKNLKEADLEAFAEGFTGKRITEPTPEEILTESERAIAKEYSVYDGRKGEISKDDVSFVRNELYGDKTESTEE